MCGHPRHERDSAQATRAEPSSRPSKSATDERGLWAFVVPQIPQYCEPPHEDMVLFSYLQAPHALRNLIRLSVNSRTIRITPSLFRHRRTLASLGVRHKAASSVEPTILPSDVSIEEELSPGYDPRDFCPVNPGDIFNDRYEVIAKLGCGSSSTVWLGRDMKR